MRKKAATALVSLILLLACAPFSFGKQPIQVTSLIRTLADDGTLTVTAETTRDLSSFLAGTKLFYHLTGTTSPVGEGFQSVIPDSTRSGRTRVTFVLSPPL